MKIYRPATEIVGIDVFESYLEFCRGLGIYTRILKHDLGTVLPFSDRHFEVALAVEVIEHMPKDDGLRLLDELERSPIVLSSRHQIVSTNNPSMTRIHIKSIEVLGNLTISENETIEFMVQASCLADELQVSPTPWGGCRILHPTWLRH